MCILIKETVKIRNIFRQPLINYFLFVTEYKAGVGKLRPSKSKSAAREHTFICNRMRPAKGNSAAREHAIVALESFEVKSKKKGLR